MRAAVVVFVVACAHAAPPPAPMPVPTPVAVAPPSRPAPPAPPSEAEILQRSHDVLDAYDRDDVAAVAAALAFDFVHFEAGGEPTLRDADLDLYWFGVNVTVLGECYRSRSMGKVGSCGRLVELGTAKATYFAGGLKPGVARSPDSWATTGEAVGWGDVADRAV